MKFVSIEISVQHVPEDSETPGAQFTTEDCSLSLSKTLGDTEASLPALKDISAELMRRYEFINARKTN